MTPAQRIAQLTHLPSLSGDLRTPDNFFAPTVLRSMLLLSGAAHPADPTLARLSDEELLLLRASLIALTADDPTSAA
jgi:hypothetical protein